MAFAIVEIENGSTIRLRELTKADFTQLGADAKRQQVNVVTLEQGEAAFHFIPEQKDNFEVKVADATLLPKAKATSRRV